MREEQGQMGRSATWLVPQPHTLVGTKEQSLGVESQQGAWPCLNHPRVFMDCPLPGADRGEYTMTPFGRFAVPVRSTPCSHS